MMTDKVQALLARAVSTDSESEALACLKKVRGLGGMPTNLQPQQSREPMYAGKPAKYWYDAAMHFNTQNTYHKNQMKLALGKLRRAPSLTQMKAWQTYAVFGWAMVIIFMILFFVGM